jgi:hypothetical protein
MQKRLPHPLLAVWAAAHIRVTAPTPPVLLSPTAVQVEDWAAAPSQVLALADAVMWTKAAAGALQRLAAGNSRALRSLCDAAALRLETISAALRRQPHASRHPASALAHAADRSLQKGSGVAAAAQAPAAASGQPAALGRPATLDTCDEVPHVSPRTSSQPVVLPGSGRALSSSNNRSSSQPPKGQLAPACHSSSNAAGKSSAATTPKQLSQQQILGLQTLASAAASHRDVAAALVAAAEDGCLSSAWQQQLRHYWEPETQELKASAWCCIMQLFPCYHASCSRGCDSFDSDTGSTPQHPQRLRCSSSSATILSLAYSSLQH